MKSRAVAECVFVAILNAFASEAIPASQEQFVRLSLQECRIRALQNNLSFRVQRLQPLVSEARLKAALAPFDPAITASFSGSRTQQPNSLVFDPSTGTYISQSVPAQNSLGTRLGISKAFPFGTNASINLNNSWSKGSGSSNYGSNISLSVSQPLLRGFGRDANEAGIRIARANRETSMKQIVADASAAVQKVESAYWDLVSARENLRVAQMSHQYAQQLLERSRARAETGAQALRDVIQAEAGVATAYQGIISAEARVRDAEDTLRRLTNIAAMEDGWSFGIIPTDTTHIDSGTPSFDSLFAAALENNPAVFQAAQAVETSKFTLKYRYNGLLPTLDASTEIVLRDGDRTAAKSMDDLPTAAYPSWTLGLRFSVPLGNRQSEASYREAIVAVRTAELELQDARQAVQADVRSALRRVETSRQQIAAAEETKRLRESTLENEQERLRLGLSTNYDVLQVERDVADARRAYVEARVEHERALLALDVATGLLLRKRDIGVEMDGSELTSR
ncbi:MAG TPA: TolC family protein [Candidatus Latescibacteria bacterium]|nr:TolC family protein [Candidatus Latescibacterota bacterium]